LPEDLHNSMKREKNVNHEIVTEFSYVEGKLETFQKINSLNVSYRVFENGKVGIYSQNGEIDDEEGYRRAEANLSREREYPYELETGKRSRSKIEAELTEVELKQIAEECMQYLKETYPQYVFRGGFTQRKNIETRTNSLGMDYRNEDECVNVGFQFKHVDSKDLVDGWFDFSLRAFDKKVFMKMADDYLANWEKEMELPEELIIDTQYYNYLGYLVGQLNAEKVALGSSLLSGKIGEKVFSEDFTMRHDVSDEICWFNTFWDGEGHVMEGDRLTLIENGKILTAYSDKRCAAKYDMPYTGNAYFDSSDVPGCGGVNGYIVRSEKTVKELLNGRYAIVMLKSDGWFNDKGELVVPVTSSLLTDGEKILGKLPAFTFKTSMYDMFGKDFIGVGSDQPIFNDKQLLFRVHKE